MELPLEKRPKMAIIPAGTTNDYARALAIPRDNIPDAAKVILKIRHGRWISVKQFLTIKLNIL